MAEKEPETFDEARTAGRDAIGAMESARIVINEYPELIKKADSADKPEMQKTLERYADVGVASPAGTTSTPAPETPRSHGAHWMRQDLPRCRRVPWE